MSKMTDKEIIQALECCISAESCCVCGYTKMCDGTTIHQFALELINRQQAEIERLNSCVKSEDEVRAIANATIQAGIKIIKATAIKEFADRLHTEIYRVTGDIIQERNERLDEIESSNIVIPFDNVLCGYNSKLQAYDHINGFIHLQYKERVGEGK